MRRLRLGFVLLVVLALVVQRARGQGGLVVSGGAPTNATYITQTANSTLSAEQALSALASGLLRVATTTGVITSLTTSADIAANISDETGSGLLVFATSPTLTTPTLGVATATTINKVTLTTPATGSTLTIADGKTLTASNTLTFTGTDTSSVAFGAGGTVAYTGNNLSVFAATTSAQLAGVLSDETGSGAAVFGTTPTISFANTGLTIQDTLGGQLLTIAPGSDLTVARTLTITTGDAARTITLSGDTTLSGTNTGDQTITLTGDVTGSGTGSFAATIAADAVTYAKIQNVSVTDRLLGRDTVGAGDIEELTIGGGVEFTGTGIQTSAFTGDVTKAAGGTALTVAADAVALTTDTTGNYVASVANGLGITGGSAGSEGAALTLAFDVSALLSGDHALSANDVKFGVSGLIFEGSVADTFETYFSITNPTAERTFTFPDVGGTISLGTGTANQLSYWTATNTIAALGAATNGQLPIGSTGVAPVLAALTGTANQVTITNGAGTITLAAPQNIHTAATPQFARMGLGAAADATHFLLLSGGTVTVDTHLIDATQTWNSGVVTFTGLKLNVTDTASAAASLLADLQVGGVSKFKVDKAGVVTADGSGLTALNAGNISTGTLAIARGGTNSGTALNNSRIMVSSAGAIIEAGAMTNGQLLIGSTGAAPAVAALTAGSNITITNGAGTITIASTAGGSAPFVDTTSIVEGSVDATKEIRFEVDTNVPTATVVVATVPASNFTMAGIDLAQTFSADQTFTGAESAISASGTFTNSAGEKILVNLTPTSQSGTLGNPIGIKVNLAAGYTGSSYNYAGYFINAAAGTGTAGFGESGNLNLAVFGIAQASTTGDNVGLYGKAQTSSGRNIGVIGQSDGGVTNRIGVVGQASDGATNDIGVYAYIGNTAPTLTSAALIANNGASTDPIFLAQDNGTTVFQIVDGGNTRLDAKLSMNVAADANFDIFSSRGFAGNMGAKFTNTNTANGSSAQLRLINDAADELGLYIRSSLTPNGNAEGPGDVSLYGTKNIKFHAQGTAGLINFVTGATASTGLALTLNANQHEVVGGAAPTVAGSCGTGPTIAGVDGAHRITTGTGAPTSCTVTFNKTWTTAPVCVATDETTANAMRAAATTTTVVITGTMVAGDVLGVLCRGY